MTRTVLYSMRQTSVVSDTISDSLCLYKLESRRNVFPLPLSFGIKPQALFHGETEGGKKHPIFRLFPFPPLQESLRGRNNKRLA